MCACACVCVCVCVCVQERLRMRACVTSIVLCLLYCPLGLGRSLHDNSFGGTLPASLSALTVLTLLCASPPALVCLHPIPAPRLTCTRVRNRSINRSIRACVHVPADLPLHLLAHSLTPARALPRICLYHASILIAVRTPEVKCLDGRAGFAGTRPITSSAGPCPCGLPH